MAQNCLAIHLVVVWITIGFGFQVNGEEPASQAPVLQGIERGIHFYQHRVAHHDGYAYYYSADLQQVWGEGKIDRDLVVVQPPGTPTVGLAYLRAFETTKNQAYLAAARETAEALIAGQLVSGGWTQVIAFKDHPLGAKYRTQPRGDRNYSSLDDGQTQTALRFLIRCDEALNQQHAAIHEAVSYGLDALLKAQFANGGFPQVWNSPVVQHPIVKARYPTVDWRTEGRIKNYWDQYTLNDNLAGSVAATLIEAHRVYGEARYLQALSRLGDFLVLAQMPAPQPAWCQQYNAEMVPIWARKFEPPAITGWESQDAMRTLMQIARYTRQSRYLEPVPAALAYLKPLVLPDGNVARYYELKTNRPLYMTVDYQLTYDESLAPSHYGWKQPQSFAAIEQEYIATQAGNWKPAPQRSRQELEPLVQKILAAQSPDGRWESVFEGERLVGQPKFPLGFHYVSSDTFCRNLETLCEYLEADAR